MEFVEDVILPLTEVRVVQWDVAVSVEAFWMYGRGGKLLAVWQRAEYRAEGEQSPDSA